MRYFVRFSLVFRYIFHKNAVLQIQIHKLAFKAALLYSKVKLIMVIIS